MKKMTRLMMIVLSYAPITSIAVAAHAKANEIDGEMQSTRLQSAERAARHRLIPTGEMGTTMLNAVSRYSQITGLVGEPLKQSMSLDLYLLKKAGLIEFDEKNILSGGQSEHHML
ncbi:MAG: hypothetical protein EOP04_17605 [Proteobacteria bacterium]|nr:MAG: hypothetical protein EOP04_17605 [Pseudomonadota bacterium]